MSIGHILFDLDGTLLPMVQEEFVHFYMPLLANAYISRGVRLDPKSFIGSVWAGYEAMVKNDGTLTNREAFWTHIQDKLPISPGRVYNKTYAFVGSNRESSKGKRNGGLSRNESGVPALRDYEPYPLGRAGRRGF